MAITLDELLGRNTQAVQNTVERFPSYEEFKSSRQSAPRMEQNNSVRYNFDMAPAQPLRSVESVREYEQSRPYVAPHQSEYQTREYAFYDNLRPQSNVQTMQQPVIVQPVVVQPQVQEYQIAQPQARSLYEFAAQDSERLSEEELFNRLSHTNAVQEQVSQKQSVFARRAVKAQSNTKNRTRLNAKGKLIVAAYVAVVAIVVSLIAVNASKINAGEAVQPSSNFSDTSIVQIENK